MDKSNVKRIAAMLVGAAVCFYLAPVALSAASADIQAMGTLILMLVINQIVVGVAGWQANYIPKIGFYVPLAMVVLYLLSELLYYGAVSWTMELNYLETGYIAYFLKKLFMRKQMIDQKKGQKPFPKGVGRK